MSKASIRLDRTTMKSMGRFIEAGVLASCAGVLILGVVWFMPDRVAVPTNASHSIDLSRDPGMGSPLPLNESIRSDVHGKAVLPGSRRDLLVYGGSCAGCSINAVRFDRLPKDQFDRILVVYEAKASQVLKSFPKPTAANVFLLSDPLGRVTSGLNAAFLGRWYAYRNGRLVAIQQRDDDRSWGRQ